MSATRTSIDGAAWSCIVIVAIRWKNTDQSGRRWFSIYSWGGVNMSDELRNSRDTAYDKWRAKPNLNSPPGCLRLGVISDLHLGADGTAGPLGHSELFLQDDVMQQNLDLLVLNGDLTGNGIEGYPLVEELFAKIHPVSYYLSGNTEARTAETLARYHQIAQRPLDSVVVQQGIRLVFLGVAEYGHEIPIAASRIRWLEEQLSDHQRTTIVFHHLPLADTVYNSGDLVTLFPGAYPFNTRVPADDSQAVREVLRRHPEVKLWVSGHTHPDHRAVDRLGNATTHREIGCLRLAVTNLGYRKPTPEGRLIVVEPGRILIRTRR
ncbi:MAG: metallophosphoesterase, partial [Fuerstiella sp.]